MAWNSLIAGFGAASFVWNAALSDCATLENAEGSASPGREPGTTTTKNSATAAETPTAAAKRAAMVQIARFEFGLGFAHDLGIERMAQRVRYGALELVVESRRRHEGAIRAAVAHRGRSLTQPARCVVQGVAGIEMILLTDATHTLTPHGT